MASFEPTRMLFSVDAAELVNAAFSILLTRLGQEQKLTTIESMETHKSKPLSLDWSLTKVIKAT